MGGDEWIPPATWKHPIHLYVMRELEEEFVDDGVLADGLVDGHQFHIGHLGDEVGAIEVAQLLRATSSRHCWHVVPAGIEMAQLKRRKQRKNLMRLALK